MASAELQPLRRRRVMIAVVLLGLIVAFGVVLWPRPQATGTTVTVATGNGFVSMSTSEARTTPVPRDRYERVLARYLEGDLFDTLWIAHKPGLYDGVLLTRDGHNTDVDVQFLPLKEPARIAAFRKRMKVLGHVGAEDRWNIGMGADMESLTIAYRVPSDASLSSLLDRVLTEVDGPYRGAMHVHPSKSEPPVSAVRVTRERDFLAEIP